MMKKLMSILLVVAMMVCLVPFASAAGDEAQGVFALFHRMQDPGRIDA